MERIKDIVEPTTPFSPRMTCIWLSPDMRTAAGKALRDKIPLELHGRWNGVKGDRNSAQVGRWPDE